MLPHVLRGACNKQLRELFALDGTAHTTRFLAAALLVLSDPRRQTGAKMMEIICKGANLKMFSC